MSRFNHLLRGGALLAALTASLACADQVTDAPAPAGLQAPRANATAAAPIVNLRVMIDTVTRGLIENGTGAYDVPSAGALDTFALAIDAVLAGDPAGADQMLDRYGYDVVSIIEATNMDSLVVFRERIPSGGDVPLGWGTYVYNPQAQTEAQVHANHPVDDQHSEDVAGDLFRGARARWFLMAGARRAANADGSADMARVTNSVFHRVHTEVAAPGTRALSIHGFRIENHAGELPADAELVLSTGRSTAVDDPVYGPVETDLRSDLVAADFVAGLSERDPGYDALAGTLNPQGRHSNDTLGFGRWIHIEHERSLRNDSTAWKQSNAVIRQWIIDHP